MTEREITCCPACDSASIRRRTGSVGAPPTDSERYYCYDCGSGFDTPATKRTEHAPGRGGGVARKLLDADPDNWP